jgi:hypothetical protein
MQGLLSWIMLDFSHKTTEMRNLGQRYDIRGLIKPWYKQYLTDIMQSDSPLGHLPKMYDALQYYAGHLGCWQGDPKEAFKAMENDNVENFKHIRQTIIEKATARIVDG